jgi:GET complex subunit GET2
MSSSSAAEQARLRRERREKKILAQGSSRLEKIAGLQGGATAREALHPDPAEPDISNLSEFGTSSSNIRPSPDATRDRTHAVSPRWNVFGVDGGDEDPFNMLRRGNDPFANMPEELKNDPMMKLLLENPTFGQIPFGAGDVGVEGTSREPSSDDLNRLAEKINKQLLGGLSGSQQSEEVVVVPDTLIWKWKLARIVSVISVLGYLCNQLEDYHFSRNVDITWGIVTFPFIRIGLIWSQYSTPLSCFLSRYRPFVLSSIKVDHFLGLLSQQLDRSFLILSEQRWLALRGIV